MPWCENCKEEYIDGVKRCRVCGDILSDTLPSEDNKKSPLPKKEKNEYREGINEVFLFETDNQVEFALVTETLKYENIPFYFLESGSGEYLRIIYNFNIFGKKIYVSAQNYNRAIEIFDYFNNIKCKEIDYDETLDKIDDKVLIRYMNRRKIIIWAIRVHLIFSVFLNVI